LKSRVFSGLSWSTLDYVLMITIQLASLICYTRILDPESYGLFAFCTIFSTFGNSVFALGMAPALIRARAEFKYYANVAWTANLFISIIAFIVLNLFLPGIMSFLDQDFQDVNIEIRATLTVVIISGFNNIGVVEFMKNIYLKPILFYNTIPKLLAFIVGICLAFYGYAHWALILALILEACLRVFISYIICGYRPAWEFDLTKFSYLYQFGGWLQLKNIVSWISSQIDSIAMVAVSNTAGLGYYNRSVTISRLLENSVLKVINTVTYPYMSERKNIVNYNERLVSTIMGAVLLIMIYINIMVFRFGSNFILWFFGEGWVEIMIYLPLLIFAGTVQSVVNIYQPLIRVLGRTKLEFLLFAFKSVLLILLLFALIPSYSVRGILYSIIIANIATVGLMFCSLNYISTNTIRPVIKSIMPAIFFFLLAACFNPSNIYFELVYLHSAFLLSVYFISNRLRKLIML